MSAEAEDRTQAPSKRRRQQAKEQGQAAHSPELTGAVGLLAVSAVMALWGDHLFLTLLSLLREPLQAPPGLALAANPSELVSTLRHVALTLIAPLGLALAAFSAGAILAHQVQVQGLWAPGLLVPDPMRLWTIGQNQDWIARVRRGLWSLVKAAIILAVAFLVLRSNWFWFQSLGRLDTLPLARAVGQAIRQLLFTLAFATLVLGLIDFTLQFQRFETLLRLSPEQHREDMRAVEGDPALRARRRHLARSLRADSPEILAGASLILTGPAGLTVVLAGGPPPQRASVRSIVSGPSGEKLRQLAKQSQIRQITAPALTNRFAQCHPPLGPLSADLMADLSLIWL